VFGDRPASHAGRNGVVRRPASGYAGRSARETRPAPGNGGRPGSSMSETIWFLKRCPLFERLSPAESQRLEACARARLFAKREMIYFPEDSGQTVLLLARGRVKIKTVTPDGRETIFAFIEAGEVFGELALVDAEPRQEFAEAVEDSLVLALPREDILWLMGQRPDVALHITKLLGFRRRRIENRLRNTLFRSTRERIVGLLLELLQTHGGRTPNGGWEIRLKLSHQDLANLIGATRESVTLALGRLQRDRLIAVQRRLISVPDRARLMAAADDCPGLASTRRPGGDR
jgi:CRP/FNR family transcriptional regulator, cyclic AMP receptor protein